MVISVAMAGAQGPVRHTAEAYQKMRSPTNTAKIRPMFQSRTLEFGSNFWALRVKVNRAKRTRSTTQSLVAPPSAQRFPSEFIAATMPGLYELVAVDVPPGSLPPVPPVLGLGGGT